MADEKKVNLFGIRHLSPAGAFYLRKFLDRIQPELVLIEGPSDFDDRLIPLTDPKVKPPVAIMAYTQEAPVRTILYPFAVYSPEYQAALWARENHCACHFMDLPSGVMLALDEAEREEALKQMAQEEEIREEKDAGRIAGDRSEEEAEEEKAEEESAGLTVADVYEHLDKVCGEDSHETFWEHVLEQAEDEEAYRKGAALFGENIRSLSESTLGGTDNGKEMAFSWTRTERNHLRETYMKRKIEDAIASGIAPEKIVAVTGGYYV